MGEDILLATKQFVDKKNLKYLNVKKQIENRIG